MALFLALLRLNEPIVVTTFKHDVTRCLCGSSKSKRGGSQVSNRSTNPSSISDNRSTVDPTSYGGHDARKGGEDGGDVLADSLNAFLTSSLNVELVYTILKGIRRIVKTPDLETWKNGQVPKNASNDFSMRLTLDHIKIKNFQSWEDVH